MAVMVPTIVMELQPSAVSLKYYSNKFLHQIKLGGAQIYILPLKRHNVNQLKNKLNNRLVNS